AKRDVLPFPGPSLLVGAVEEPTMPIFDLGGWPHVHAALPGYRILATMIYPQDDRSREELLATLVARFYAMTIDTPEAWTQPPSVAQVGLLLLARDRGGSQDDVFQGVHQVAPRGSVAGEALMLIRQMAAHGDEGSVNKACHILAQAGKAKRLTGGGMRIPFTNPTALRDNAWMPYRSVAHLWAAHNLMWNFRWAETPDGAPISITWYESTPDLERILALAENFRQWGETYLSS